MKTFLRSGSSRLLAGGLALCVMACSDKDVDIDSLVRELVPGIEKSTGLEFRTPPKIEIRTSEQVREYVVGQMADSAIQAKLAGVETAYQTFGLIPDTLDLQKFLLSLLEEQVVGYYDPKTKVLYIVENEAYVTSKAGRDALRATLAHELVHALQDQYVNLDSVQTSTDNNDKLTATQAVFEGQAVYEQLRVTLGPGFAGAKIPGGWDRMRDAIRNSQESMPVFSAAPRIVQETLLFPYLSGAEFIRAYRERSAEPLDYAQMPFATSHISRPSTFFDSTLKPSQVVFNNTSSLDLVYENTLGEFETRVLIFEFLGDVTSATRGAAAWAGDRYVVYRTPEGGAAVAWAVVLNSDESASIFYSVMERVADSRNSKDSGREARVTMGTVGGKNVLLYVDSPRGAGARPPALSSISINP